MVDPDPPSAPAGDPDDAGVASGAVFTAYQPSVICDAARDAGVRLTPHPSCVTEAASLR